MIIRWGSGCCAHARAPQGFTAGLPESSRSKHDTPQHRYLTVVVYTRVLHSTVSPISSTNHPRSLPVPNRPSAGSKAANMASVGLLSSLKYVLNLLKIFFILWLFYSHHFGHHLILDVEYQPDPTNKMSKYTFFQSHLGWFSQCSSLPFSSSFHWWPMHRCCEPN